MKVSIAKRIPVLISRENIHRITTIILKFLDEWYQVCKNTRLINKFKEMVVIRFIRDDIQQYEKLKLEYNVSHLLSE